MSLLQSERKLSRQLDRALKTQDKLRSLEKRATQEEQDFLVYLPDELEVNALSYHHYQLLDEDHDTLLKT